MILTFVYWIQWLHSTPCGFSRLRHTVSMIVPKTLITQQVNTQAREKIESQIWVHIGLVQWCTYPRNETLVHKQAWESGAKWENNKRSPCLLVHFPIIKWKPQRYSMSDSAMPSKYAIKYLICMLTDVIWILNFYELLDMILSLFFCAGSSELHVHHVERQFSSGRKNVPRNYKKLVLISCPVQHCTNVNYVPPVRTSWWNCTGEKFGEFSAATNKTSAMLYPAFTMYNRKWVTQILKRV